MNRSSHKLLRVLFLLGVMFSAQVIAADSVRYVNDHLIITLRAGQGSEYKILKSLPSGTRLELLEQTEGTDFSKVRTADGTEGWVRSWYLSETPTAKLLLEEAVSKAERLEAENKKLRSSGSASDKSNNELRQKLNKFESENAKLLKENSRLKDIASRPIELESENKRLTAEAQRINAENKQYSTENQELRQSSVQKWFMAGSGVLIAGIVLGLVLPRFRRSKSAGWA